MLIITAARKNPTHICMQCLGSAEMPCNHPQRLSEASSDAVCWLSMLSRSPTGFLMQKQSPHDVAYATPSAAISVQRMEK